jgi:hypothetical protein
MAALSTTRRPAVGIVGPPVLWSVHFLFVYVFVSLACVWGWGGLALLGIGAIEWVVALATVLIGAAIVLLGLRGWRETAAAEPDRGGDGDGAAAGRRRFSARMAVLMSGLFLVAILLVGLPTLVRPSCY